MNDDFSLYLSDYQNIEKEFRFNLKKKLDIGEVNEEYLNVNNNLFKSFNYFDLFI